MKITILDLLQELSCYVEIDPKDLEAAKNSKITNENNQKMKLLCHHWTVGAYDEDPEILCQRLTALL